LKQTTVMETSTEATENGDQILNFGCSASTREETSDIVQNYHNRQTTYNPIHAIPTFIVASVKSNIPIYPFIFNIYEESIKSA
jgi:hypothetical protein